jgi:hypothetical protein
MATLSRQKKKVAKKAVRGPGWGRKAATAATSRKTKSTVRKAKAKPKKAEESDPSNTKDLKAGAKIVRLTTCRSDWMLGRTTRRGIKILGITFRLMKIKPLTEGSKSTGAPEFAFVEDRKAAATPCFVIDATQPDGTNSKIIILVSDVTGYTIADKEYSVGMNDRSYESQR